MKILITAYDFYPNTGGVATYSLELANSLHQQGHEILLVTRNQGQIIDTPFPVQYVALPKFGLLSVPGLSFALTKIIKKFKPDSILSTLWMPGGAATFLALKSVGQEIPFYVVVHAMEILENETSLKGRFRKALRPLKNKVFSQAQKIFCVSEFSKSLTLQETKSSESKTVVIHNGVNPEKFGNFSNSLSSTDSYPNLLTVGRLAPHKGVDTVIHSLPKVIERFPSLKYRIVGSGPMEEKLKSLCQKLQLEKHVDFLGKVPASELPQYYGEADLFILLSRQEKHHVEGFGLVFLEAALCKTPSLGGRSGGIPDAIIEEKTGWLTDPLDSEKTSQKLIELFETPEELKAMGEQAANYTLNHRTWNHVAKEILKHMESPQ